MKPGFLYSKQSIPAYLCPTCVKGKMLPDIEGCLSRQTGESVLLSKLDYWEESFHKEMLRIDLSCTNGDCKEIGVLILEGELYSSDEHQPEVEVLFTPIYINPAPQLFSLEAEYPDNIRKIAQEAFSLFWSDPASCGNKIRVGVEALLNEQGVEQERKDKNGIAILSKKGRPKPIMLHHRLEIFKKTSASSASALESIKWLGNESSHSGTLIHQSVVYKAVMIFGSVLAHLYCNQPIEKEINYSIEHVNFWHHPDKQKLWPKKT
ncbi:DUF4145 domain-containing protein [Shewanella sp. NKUCC05_KAH]|uniref:DUF4145 domain-containing protein n=1 Tax=Shewanella sp. NKUCC05_KAH TaxID=2842126 RepID=UPI001C5B39DF|nr:DUF4145 domain-containing protein [Shewanella sp. NKUCC05_KAH]MBW3529034.1 DUF4145 domain-containing protein [Shewanella sp. NKUCC05_KAH]